MVVMDCSALAEMMLGTEVGAALKQLLVKNERIVAPDLLYAELVSVARKAVRSGTIGEDEVDEAITRALNLVNIFMPAQVLYSESLLEGIRLDHSIYDMFYFVLARRTGATLFTVDKKLSELCWANGVNCIDEIAWLPE